MDRRDFLKSGSGTLAAPAILAQRNPNDRIGVGGIGVGVGGTGRGP